MFCHQCGNSLPAGSNFCSACGAKVNPGVYTASPLNTMYRPRALRMIGGVCAAISLRWGWDLTATRIVAVVLGIFLFPLSEIAYLVAWLLIPEEAPLMAQPYVDPQPR